MKNFRINQPSDHEPDTPAYKEYLVGTTFSFRNIGGQLRAAISIPVTIVS